jgi:peptidoglycan/xylan/chitin deacetylase (PgdA/CDA1 family)
MRVSPTVRVLGVCAVVITAIIGSSYALGQATPTKFKPEASSVSHVPPAADAAAAPSPTALPAASPAASAAASPAPDGGRAPVRQAAARQQLPGAAGPMAQPIVGPGRPPMAAEKGGPFGARRSTGTPQVALTFDDGPDPTYTPQTLDLLRRYNVKATFCLVGINVRAFPELVRRIADEGHTLCNHSWSHDTGMGLRSKASIKADLERTNAEIHKAAPGHKVSYYRQPGGAWTASIVAVARQLGMTSLHWAVDPQDWTRPGASSISSRVNSGTARGSIVLMHDAGGDRRGTVSALRSILPNLTRRFQLAALAPGIDPPMRFGRDLPLKTGQR